MQWTEQVFSRLEGHALGFVFGINYPWLRCGHDFGPRPPAWSGAPRTDWRAVGEELEDLASLGLTVVRIWVFAGGVNLPVGRAVEQVATRVRRGYGQGDEWRWHAPLVLPRSFLDDFQSLLGVARRAGVRLLPSLVSFELFGPIAQTAGGVPKRGHRRLALGETFYDATLEPLLDVSQGYRDTLAAWEIINEPGWATRRWVSPDAMSAWLAEGCRRVAARDFVASVGFTSASPRWLTTDAVSTLRRLAAAGRYVHQLHHYPQGEEHVLPPAAMSPIRPCWVGEMATSLARRWRDPEALEEDPDRYLARRLEVVRARGYEGALLWSVHANDAQTRWSDRIRAQIRAITAAASTANDGAAPEGPEG